MNVYADTYIRPNHNYAAFCRALDEHQAAIRAARAVSGINEKTSQLNRANAAWRRADMAWRRAHTHCHDWGEWIAAWEEDSPQNAGTRD